MALSSEPQHAPSKTIDQLRRWRIQIFAATWIVYFALYFTRQAYSAAKVGILEDPSMSAMTEPMMGVLDATYLTAYAVASASAPGDSSTAMPAPGCRFRRLRAA